MGDGSQQVQTFNDKISPWDLMITEVNNTILNF